MCLYSMQTHEGHCPFLGNFNVVPFILFVLNS